VSGRFSGVIVDQRSRVNQSMIQKQFRAGEILFKEGEPSDHALRIVSGEVDVVKENEGEAVVLGTAKAGDFIGEMGVIQEQPRIATARAVSAVTVEVFPKDAFLKQISEDSQLAFRLLSRLSERLKVVSQAFVEAVTMGSAQHDPRERDAAPALSPLRLFADSNRLVRLLPSEGVLVTPFPPMVGRLPKETEIQPALPLDLALQDVPPFRLSRMHFSIDREDGAYVVRDMHSNLGTEVNGYGLGDHFASDRTPLRVGENVVVAGGKGSSFRFRLVLEE